MNKLKYVYKNKFLKFFFYDYSISVGLKNAIYNLNYEYALKCFKDGYDHNEKIIPIDNIELQYHLNDDAVVVYKLTYGIQPNPSYVVKTNTSLLHWVVINYEREISKLLFEDIINDVDVNITDSNGFTPLFYALKNYELTKRLLERGADVDYQTKDMGHTPLRISMNYRDEDIDTALLLLKYGAVIPRNINDYRVTKVNTMLKDILQNPEKKINDDYIAYLKLKYS